MHAQQLAYVAARTASQVIRHGMHKSAEHVQSELAEEFSTLTASKRLIFVCGTGTSTVMVGQHGITLMCVRAFCPKGASSLSLVFFGNLRTFALHPQARGDVHQ